MRLYREELPKLIAQFEPQFILISCGFDAHTLDPLGNLFFESEDYGELTCIIRKLAISHCQGRLLSVLEGGYNLTALAESSVAHVRALSS